MRTYIVLLKPVGQHAIWKILFATKILAKYFDFLNAWKKFFVCICWLGGGCWVKLWLMSWFKKGEIKSENAMIAFQTN